MNEKVADLFKRFEAMPLGNQLFVAAQLFNHSPEKEELAITLAENVVMTWQAQQIAKRRAK